MKPSDFFIEEQDPEWDLRGADPWAMTSVFNSELVSRLRTAPQADIPDSDAAYGLAQLAHGELLAYGTGGGNKLDDDEMTTLLRALRVVLKRLGLTLDVPFRDFKGFHGYWSNHDMGGSWAARRGYVNDLFSPILARLDELEDEKASDSIRGVDGQLKNIIFASTGPKPRIILRDAINNVIEVVENAESCLVYDRQLGESGLTWGALTDWWRSTNSLAAATELEVARSLYVRLSQSIAADSPPEQVLFRTYCESYGKEDGDKMPALLPQVYLHYDPYTRRERRNRPGPLSRERMDFLLLFSNGIRVVLEVDGKQHYAEGNVASPRLYSEMVSEDRKLRLRGYDVYRFGGAELGRPGADAMLRYFFSELLAKYETPSERSLA